MPILTEGNAIGFRMRKSFKTARARPSLRRVVICVLTLASLSVGLPAAGAQPAPERLFGDNRYETAAAVAAAAYPDGAGTVLVATGRNFPDALAATPAAHRAQAPVLLVTPDAVPAASIAALQRLDPAEIVLLGGEHAISRDVANQLADAAPKAAIERIAGANRYATAAAIAGWANGLESSTAFIASGEDFPDSLGAGPLAASANGALLLTEPSALPRETVDSLEQLQPSEIVVLGGATAISERVVSQLTSLAPTVTRLSGADRYATAAAINERMDTGTSHVVLVRGDDFADGLAAGPYAAALGAPILLADSSCTPAPTLSTITQQDPEAITLVGGQAALHEHVADLIPCPTVLAQGLTIPWGVTFDADGRAYVGERTTGRILRFDGSGSPTEEHRLDIDVFSSGGLMGLVADAAPGVLYAFITTESDNRVVRIAPDGSVEPVLTGIPRGTGHFGGGLALGDDGMLYVATGDGRRPNREAQDPNDLGGKILRITPSGDVPADNPIPGSPVYALGLRNPQGLAWDSQGRLLATDFGPDRDDEINVIVPGGNYGWPDVTGASDHPDYLDPLIVRQPAEASWSGLTVLNTGGIPAWQDSVFAGSLRGEKIWRFELAEDGTPAESEPLYVGRYGRIRTVAEAPDGALWFTTTNRDNRGGPPSSVDDRVIRVGPPPQAP